MVYKLLYDLALIILNSHFFPHLSSFGLIQFLDYSFSRLSLASDPSSRLFSLPESKSPSQSSLIRPLLLLLQLLTILGKLVPGLLTPGHMLP